MKLKKLLYLALLPILIISCSEEDDGINKGAPVIEAHSFTVSEAIGDEDIIGNLKAEDPNGDPITFKIGVDRDGLFEVTDAGALSLIEGANLDFETSRSHKFTVGVTDGRGIYFGIVTVTVTDDEDPPVIPENQSPVIAPQTFEVSENILDTDIIGMVQALDEEGDALTFSIVTDDSNLFTITEDGELSLSSGNNLDFSTAEEHTLIVSVTDGNTSSQSTITIVVTEGIAMVAQSFDVAETIDDSFVIGTIMATDPENDPLTFAIVINDNNLFKISENGELSLASGNNLDAETNEVHTITVSATDNNDTGTAETQITINVLDRFEGTGEDPEWFVTTWNPNNVFGLDVEMVVDTQYTYDFTVDWGDGTVEQRNEFVADDDFFSGSSKFVHTYQAENTYTVAIKGDFPYVSAVASPTLIRTIEQWGEMEWESFMRSFESCSFLTYNATDVPDLTQVEDMRAMFLGADNFNGDLNGWDTVNVTNMVNMFANADSFNGDISDWNTANVTSMAFMFSRADSFNGDISGWDTGLVTSFRGMFTGTNSFNGDISEWNTENVTDMAAMFDNAISFDRNLGGWNLINVENMSGMLSDSGLSALNYSATLTGWANNPNTPDSLTLDAIGLNYCNNMQTLDAVDGLINTKGWTITDDGPIVCP